MMVLFDSEGYQVAAPSTPSSWHAEERIVADPCELPLSVPPSTFEDDAPRAPAQYGYTAR